MKHNDIYYVNIYERYSDLKRSEKQVFDNNNLWKIFEFYSCIKLSEEFKKPFYLYDDIDPNFKEQNNMSQNDSGIDCCDLINTIVQCKLRKNSLTWRDCATFIGSQVIFSYELNKKIIRWDNLIITRNSDCKLSKNLMDRKDLFLDKSYTKKNLIAFCENLFASPPKIPVINNNWILRDYQIDAINLITQSNNTIINLPTGTGKNSIIIYSMQDNQKYLILVPRIILMEQLKDEIIKHKPHMKSKIQLIGDSSNTFNPNKLITICVFNSVHLIEKYCMSFNKIFVDEAHHINKPLIYSESEEYDDDEELNENTLEYQIKKYSKYTKEMLFDELNNLDSNNELLDDNNLEDLNDELVDVKKYTNIIKDLSKYNNNVYLSATIDQTENFEYFSRDIRTMIDMGYLSDYQIHIPIFSDDPTNNNICEHLLASYRSIIIYCNSQKEGIEINKLMNELQANSCEYIDCNTPRKTRNIIIEKYKNGIVPFIVNVRILVEGFDAPITKGVCFLHLPTSKTTLIQIIGRALRLHSSKTIANIILPFSKMDDGKSINSFLRTIAKNDSRIKQSFLNKKVGGYICIENVVADKDDNEEQDDEKQDDDDVNDIEFKFNMIYNSLGVLQNFEEIWMIKLEEVKQYINKNNKRPSVCNTITKKLGIWISTQIANYKNKLKLMKHENIYNTWTNFINDPKYKKYFMSTDNLWFGKLDEVIDFININNARPSMGGLQGDNNIKNKQMANWISHQLDNYKNKKELMKTEEIYNAWTEFVNDLKYKKYFQTNEDLWNETLEQVINYIDENNRRPTESDVNITAKELTSWIYTQITNYKNKKKIMNNEIIYNKWSEFVNNSKYKKYFLSNEDEWCGRLNEVINYIDENNCKLSQKDDNKEVANLAQWLNHQKRNYKNKLYIMKNENIYNKWTGFINNSDYKKYI